MPSDVLNSFHPAVAGWFRSRFPEPTEAQRRAWAVTSQHRHALIAAPTGSGKTLAAFLSAIDDLVREGLLEGPRGRGPRALRVAAEGAVQRHPQEPAGAAGRHPRPAARAWACPTCGIRDAVRTGDTPAAERERMRQAPPHILVTTPESLYILLSSDSGRAMLKSRQERDRRRAARGGRQQARLAPDALAGAAGGAVRAAAGAHRPVRHGEAARGDGALPGRQPRDRRRDHRRRPCARPRPRDRDAALAARPR